MAETTTPKPPPQPRRIHPYMYAKDSALYDRARAGTIPAPEAQVIIEKLLERLADWSRHAERQSMER